MVSRYISLLRYSDITGKNHNMSVRHLAHSGMRVILDQNVDVGKRYWFTSQPARIGLIL